MSWVTVSFVGDEEGVDRDDSVSYDMLTFLYWAEEEFLFAFFKLFFHGNTSSKTTFWAIFQMSIFQTKRGKWFQANNPNYSATDAPNIPILDVCR